MTSPFDLYDTLPPDPIFFISAEAAADKRAEKVDLTIGIYKNEQLQSMIFESIKDAERSLLQTEENKDYLPIGGDQAFINAARDLVLGPDQCGRACVGVQTLGGTGALCLGAGLLGEVIKAPVWISEPSWVNHRNIFAKAGFEIKTYPYYDRECQALDMKGFLDALNGACKGSVVILHGCCHNPSGTDPSLAQWQEVSDLCKARNLIPFFDLAYQGFGEGLEEDVRAIRFFAKDGHEMLIAQSFSKNLGLYGERVGALHVLAREGSGALSHIKALARASYSNPPRHGSLLATQVLQSEQLRVGWESELQAVRERVVGMRLKIADALEKACSHRNFSYLHARKGMFCYLDLNKDQIEKLKMEKAIYLTQSGRMNVTGLNDDNVMYVADAIAGVLG